MRFIPPPLCECPSAATEQVTSAPLATCAVGLIAGKQTTARAERRSCFVMQVRAQMDRQDGWGSCSEGTAMPGIEARGFAGSGTTGCGQSAAVTC